MSAVTAWALVAGAGLGLGLWLLVSMLPRLDRPRLTRRLAPYLLDVSAGAREASEPASPGPLPVLGAIAGPAADPLLRAASSLLGSAQSVRRRLRQSGSASTVEGYRAQQVAATIAGAAAGVALAVAAAPAGAAVQAVAVGGGALAGLLTRDALLTRAARSRLTRLGKELPVVLEFLALSLSAGEGILDALRRVARTGTGELSRELAAAVAEVATGIPLAEALVRIDRDLDLPPLSRTIEQLVSALERGSPLGEVLRAQAEDSREVARRDLLEAAGRKEIAMLFPLVFLILPVTVLFAVFPGLVVLQLGF